MKPALALSLLVIVAPVLCSAQDAELRSSAVALLERAHAVSLAPDLPSLERVDTFRVFDPNSRAREGSFSRVVVQGVGRREETTFGDYHVTRVWTGSNTRATSGTPGILPAEVVNLMLLTPIRLVNFDAADVIRAISDKQLGGRSLRCIEFETIIGQKHMDNELCVDATNGTLVSEKLGDDYIENSDFFPFAGALLPAKIVYSVLGSPKLEITQTMRVLSDTANVLATPPGAQIAHLCVTARGPIGQYMPQPASGRGGRDVDIVVRGTIGQDGKVHDALVQSSEWPDLNPEGLSLIAQWVFQPSLCNGKPNPVDASFVLHFHGR